MTALAYTLLIMFSHLSLPSETRYLYIKPNQLIYVCDHLAGRQSGENGETQEKTILSSLFEI